MDNNIVTHELMAECIRIAWNSTMNKSVTSTDMYVQSMYSSRTKSLYNSAIHETVYDKVEIYFCRKEERWIFDQTEINSQHTVAFVDPQIKCKELPKGTIH